eukprot:COSAG01_NODE_1134_length_11558_cov_8.381360_16_plen_83_part_00
MFHVICASGTPRARRGWSATRGRMCAQYFVARKGRRIGESQSERRPNRTQRTTHLRRLQLPAHGAIHLGPCPVHHLWHHQHR